MISVRRHINGNLQVVNGHIRLDAQLEMQEYAKVFDINTAETFFVHKIDNELIALSEEAQANLEDMTNSIINRAKH